MKRLITTYFYLASLALAAQTAGNLDLDFNDGSLTSDFSSAQITTEEDISINDTFEEAAKKNNIPYRSFDGLTDVEDGYYVIAGVYNEGRNLKKAIKKLVKKGFNAGSIENPDTNLNYVYLEKYPFGLEAVDACVSNFDGLYDEDVWILNVENGISPDAYDPYANQQVEANDASAKKEMAKTVSVEEVNYDLLNEPGNIDQIEGEKPNRTKLIQRADHYFDKMWYAEAAALYEEALQKGDKNYSYEIIQKAADSYYFNTNMEKAYEWYNLLYTQYGKDMSADNVFKYAHSLKGTGKYGRSKKLMRLYQKKLDNGDISQYDSQKSLPNEMVLDNILNSSREDYEIKNLAINTEYSDFSPMFLDSTQIVYATAKDSSFLNTRRYKWNNQPYLDLYVAKINKETQDLKDAIKFSKKINTKYHEASVSFSPDNQTMYFTRNNYGKKLRRDKNGVNNLKIYMSKKVGDEWTEAVEVPFNSDDYSTGHPALSPDGKQMYFVSDMPGSIGQTDIFVVDILGENRFSEPRNLGPEINTERKEMFPFINDQKLYFSSDGHTGLGGLDVYEVAYTEEGFAKEVKNLGQPINSNKDDFSYIVNEENQKGFFASNRADGKGDDDIYSFKRLIVEEVPEMNNAIAGVVTELITGDIMPQALVELLDENGIKLKEVVTEDDGSFVFEDLEADTKYTIKATKDTYFENTQEVTSIENDTVNVAVEMKRLKEMIAIEDGIKKLKTEMIYFDFDKSYIRNDASKELDKLVEVMTEYPEMVIKIESHTDSRGKRAYNKYLSDKRAKSTRAYIISKGIAPERIESAIGYGEEQLLNGCDGSVACTEQEHYRNRRSEFIIVNM